MPAAITFLKLERVIQIDDPETTLTVQDLVNQIRDYEDELINLDYGKIANANGKQSLGGGAQVGITLELVNDWRIQFEARPGPTTVQVSVTSGNLVATNIYANNPIKASAFTQVQILQSTSPSIIAPDSDLNLQFLVESLRGKHATLGNIFYWDPTNGVDTNDGTQPGKAVLTFAQAQTLATAGNHDIIFALSNDSSGITTVTTPITITKDTLKLRGPGYPFQIIPTTSGADSITITADSVEISGFYVETAIGGSDNGLTISGDNNLIKDFWVGFASSNGVDITGSTRTRIDSSAIENATGDGVVLGNTTTKSTISNSVFYSNANGASLAGTGLADNIFENNLVYSNSAYGISVGSGVLRTGVRLNHTFANNTSGDTQDNGTNTFIETSSGGASASSIADAVWEELITDHLASGSTGKTLNDAKKRATLASLK